MKELINKVGGIDKAKEIVDGAPDWPVIGWCAVGNNYIFKQCEHAPCSYSNFDNAWSEEYAIQFISIYDLRTAIADHDRTDFCSNFENGLSPSTTVINLEAERHG